MISIRKYLILIGAIFFGTLPIFVRNLDMNPFQILFFRVSFASIFLVPFMILLKEKFYIEDFKLLLILGLINALNMLCYITAIKYIEASTAALLLYMAPIYVVPISWLILNEKIRKEIFPAIILAFIGLILLLSVYEMDNKIGIIYGIISGMALAFIFVITKKLRDRMSVIKIIFYQMLISAIILSPSIPTIEIDKINLPVVIGLGLIPTAIAYSFYVYGIKYCKAQEASILALFEPIFVIMFSYLIFKETLMNTQFIGAILILSSIVLMEVRNHYKGP